MHITGERQVPAPRERVWKALLDAGVLQDCVPGLAVTADGDNLVLSGRGAGLGDRVLRAQRTINQPFDALGWRLDPGAAASQMLLIRGGLAEQGVYTRLSYEISLAEPGRRQSAGDGGHSRAEPAGPGPAGPRPLRAAGSRACRDRRRRDCKRGAGRPTEPGTQPTSRMTAEATASTEAASAAWGRRSPTLRPSAAFCSSWCCSSWWGCSDVFRDGACLRRRNQGGFGRSPG